MLSPTTERELHWFLSRARPARVRTLREFAESEIVIPDGPYEGRRFRCERQPYTRLWFDAVDSGHWNRFVATGPTQSGKTLACFLVPLLYHLFELGETVICGLPDMDMAADKWRENILPVIEKSRYRDLLPAHGGGSRGGKVEAIQFMNGATLKFMSGGGGDKSRAGFTSRVVVITETDGMDQPGTSSRESDKVTQLEARTRAYGVRKRIYLECTVSTQAGRTWQEFQNGTTSAIQLPCPECSHWVTPERDHLLGWQTAASQAAAREVGKFHCPDCGTAWSEPQRGVANRQARLIHAGQHTDALGTITGEPRPTETLGFRWSAVNNLFLTAGDIAADEWRASRSASEENAEREMRQFVWSLPVVPSRWEETALQEETITHRLGTWPQGIIPADATHLTAAIDLGKYLCHWSLVAWRPEARCHVVDYGRIEVASPELGVEKALLIALQEFNDLALAGWVHEPQLGDRPDRPEKRMIPEVIWIDSGYMAEVVYAFCRSHTGFYPAIGRGVSQQRQQWYNRPTATGSVVRYIGEAYHMNRLRDAAFDLIEVNADHWKTWVHQRLTTPMTEPGAMTLFQADPHSHLSLAKHLTAERQTSEFVTGKGIVTKWERIRRNNHWFDAVYNTCAAGHFVGVRLYEDETVPEPSQSWSEMARQKREARGSQNVTQSLSDRVKHWNRRF